LILLIFLMKKLLNIQWLLYHNSKQYKATLMHTHMEIIVCSIQINSIKILTKFNPYEKNIVFNPIKLNSNWIQILFKLHAMSFNVSIQMKLNFHNINFFSIISSSLGLLGPIDKY
jgi:hypothetical protein